MRLVLVHLAHWHLVRTPIVLRPLAINLFRTRPALRCTKYDHRPTRPLSETIAAGVGFDALNLADDLIQGGSHQIVHCRRIMSLNEIRRIAIATEKLIELLMTDAGENAGICDLVPIEVQNWQYRPVRRRIEELVGVPARRQRSGLRFAVARDTSHDEIRIIKGCSVGV